MIHDTFIKVGDRTVSIKGDGHRRPPAEKSAPHVLDEVVTKVVDAPEKKPVRKSSGAQHK
ncbi:hypothetical protein E2F47_23555 [Mycobacterium eburneum]|nr:hypothetical protein [Mycobacterium eburneum]TDH48496.1 hypothetical protein E2F47_23555 [Mycobacterium eburneum]